MGKAKTTKKSERRAKRKAIRDRLMMMSGKSSNYARKRDYLIRETRRLRELPRDDGGLGAGERAWGFEYPEPKPWR